MIMHPKPLTEDIAWLVEDLLRKRDAYTRMKRRKKTKENEAMMATYRASMARIRSQINELLDEGEPDAQDTAQD